MRIHIATQLQEKSWGGGNQFLLALKKYFQDVGVYEETVDQADVVLFNSYQEIAKLLKCKKQYPEKKIVYRLGPVFEYHRGKKWKIIDLLMAKIATFVADGVIFQSEWSWHEFVRLGFVKTSYKIIYNAPGQDFCPAKTEKHIHTPPRLISMSWSKNINKGFDLFGNLDARVGAGDYDMTFIGNAPFRFEHIKDLGVQEKSRLIVELSSHDIFLAPFRHEACSNAILEALGSGLPVVALDSGANRELVGLGGEVFSDFDEMIHKIDRVVANYSDYSRATQCANITSIGE